MTPNQYQIEAARTECNQKDARLRINAGFRFIPKWEQDGLKPTRLLHAAIGLQGDAGELASAIERWLYYGQELDEENVIEEIGDCLWYLALACIAVDTTLEYVMEANIGKLKQRYPEKFTKERAKEENRDREAERKEYTRPSPIDSVEPQIEQTGQGWAEPKEGE